jgi:hypothetical protein
MRRGTQAMSGLREIIENWIENEEFASAKRFLSQIIESLSTWEADFVSAARHHTVAVYKPKLSNADDLWNECDAIYGQGRPFRDIVIRKLSEWFAEHDDLEAKVERRTRQAWVSSFLNPLSKAAGASLKEDASADDLETSD